MLVFTKKNGVAFLLRDGHSHNFLLESTVLESLGGALLAPEREKILIFAANVKFFGHVFAGLRHRLSAVLGLHQWVDKSPAERGVFHFDGARIGAVSFGDNEGRARHALDAAGNHQIGLAGLDGPSGTRDGVHARTAEAAGPASSDFFLGTREQGVHPGPPWSVFPGPGCATR